MKFYRHKTCGRLSRINGDCEDCLRDSMRKHWPAILLPCGHDNTGIPFNKTNLGICDLCDFEWRNKKLSRDEEVKKAIINKMKLNRYAKNRKQ